MEPRNFSESFRGACETPLRLLPVHLAPLPDTTIHLEAHLEGKRRLKGHEFTGSMALRVCRATAFVRSTCFFESTNDSTSRVVEERFESAHLHHVGAIILLLHLDLLKLKLPEAFFTSMRHRILL